MVRTSTRRWRVVASAAVASTLLAAAAGLAGGSPASATPPETFYVTATGTNGSGTSWSSPWSGFSNIVWGSGSGQLGAGDTLYIDGGRWNVGKTYNQELEINGSGTSGSPITIAIDWTNDDHSGPVTIDLNRAAGKSGIQFGGEYTTSGGVIIPPTSNGYSYVTVNGYNGNQMDNQYIGINVTDTVKPGIMMGEQSSYNVITYVDQSDSAVDGILVGRNGHYNTLSHCRAHGNLGTYANGILIQSSNNDTVDDCASYDNRGSGIDLYSSLYDLAWNNNQLIPVIGTTIKNSYFHDNGWTARDGLVHGIYVGGPSSNITVLNNYAYHNGGAGIHVYAAPGVVITDSLVKWNASYDNGNDPRSDHKFGWGIVLAGDVEDTDVIGNVTRDNAYHGISVWDSCTNNTITGNYIYNNGMGVAGIDGADGDYRADMSTCTLNSNTYQSTVSTKNLVNWQGTVFDRTQLSTYQTTSGEEGSSVFTSTTSTPLRSGPPV